MHDLVKVAAGEAAAALWIRVQNVRSPPVGPALESQIDAATNYFNR